MPFSSNDGNRMQSIDSVKTNAYGMSKDLVNEKEEINCINIIKQYKKWLTLMMLQKKNKKKTYFQLAKNSWSSIQSINSWRLRMWKSNFSI